MDSAPQYAPTAHSIVRVKYGALGAPGSAKPRGVYGRKRVFNMLDVRNGFVILGVLFITAVASPIVAQMVASRWHFLRVMIGLRPAQPRIAASVT